MFPTHDTTRAAIRLWNSANAAKAMFFNITTETNKKRDILIKDRMISVL